MKINTPIVLITFNGNVKPDAAKVKHTAFASFDAVEKTTTIIVLVDYWNSDIKKGLKKVYKSCGKPILMKFSKSGIDIMEAHKSN